MSFLYCQFTTLLSSSLVLLFSGEENYLRVKYMAWMRLNSHLIGGMSNWNPAIQTPGVRDVYKTPYKTDLEKFNKSHSIMNPKVSLFNLADDPEEMDNLAEDFPDLVKELLAEAEDVVKDASRGLVGVMVHSDAPKGPQEGSWLQVLLTRGTSQTEVVPFGPYLEDEVDITKLKYDEGLFTRFSRLYVIFIAFKVILTSVFLLLLPFAFARCLFQK